MLLGSYTYIECDPAGFLESAGLFFSTALESKLQSALLADGVNRNGGTNRRAGAAPLLHLRFRVPCLRRGPKQGEGVGIDVHGGDFDLEGVRQGGCCPPPAWMLLADQANFFTAPLEVL